MQVEGKNIWPDARKKDMLSQFLWISARGLNCELFIFLFLFFEYFIFIYFYFWLKKEKPEMPEAGLIFFFAELLKASKGAKLPIAG
jgi:hypothetical protein